MAKTIPNPEKTKEKKLNREERKKTKSIRKEKGIKSKKELKKEQAKAKLSAKAKVSAPITISTLDQNTREYFYHLRSILRGPSFDLDSIDRDGALEGFQSIEDE